MTLLLTTILSTRFGLRSQNDAEYVWNEFVILDYDTQQAKSTLRFNFTQIYFGFI